MMIMSGKIMIGIVGANGAVKTTVCKHLKATGFFHLSLSDIVRDHIQQMNIPLSREVLVKESNILKEKYGMDYFARYSYEKSIECNFSRIVFDSVRHPVEIDYLKQRGVIMIGIETPLNLRYKRIKDRNSDKDNVSFSQFEFQDNLERSGKSRGQYIDQCLSMCEVVIYNNLGIEELMSEINDVVDFIHSQVKN